MKKLSLADNGFLQVESPTTPTHVGGVLVHKVPKGVLRQAFFQELLENLRNWFSAMPPFNQKLALAPLNASPPSLVPATQLDLDYHMRHVALPAPGSIDQLTQLVAELHTTLLDRDRPLWEFRLIEGVSDNRFAIYLKVHHSVMDGIGAMNILKSMMSDDPSNKTLALPSTRKRSARAVTPAGFAAKLGKLTDFMRKQAQTVPELGSAFKDMGLQLIQSDRSDSPAWYTAPPSPLNTPLSDQRRFVVRSFALNDFKAISKAAGVTINDAVLAVCSGALRAYFLEHNNLPEKSLVGCLPVSLRAKGGSDEGNAIASLMCSMGTDISAPLERLRHIHQSTQSGKEQISRMSKPAIEAYSILLGMPFILGQIMKTNLTPSPWNMIISNVPASDKRLYLCGAELEGLYAVNLLFERQALNITVTSYVDSLDFSLLACRQTIPDLNKIADYITAALDELLKALGVAPTKRRKPAARKI